MLATHDLEIRGAGELLGESQSGELTEIGLAMYLDMLEQAVQGAEGRPRARARPAAGRRRRKSSCGCRRCCPRATSADVHVRLALYKRIAAAPDNAGDSTSSPRRSSTASAPCRRRRTNLLRIARLKLAARALGIRRLDLGPAGRLRAVRGDRTRSTRARSYAWCRTPRRDYRLEGAAQAAHFAAVEKEDGALRVRHATS